MSSDERDTDSDRAGSTDNNATPPPNHDWGERTVQSCRTYRAPAHWKPDAYEMRQCFGVPELNEVEDYQENPMGRMPYPNLLLHERDPTRSTNSPGGETAVIRGRKGSGKSTLLRAMNVRILAENCEVSDGEVAGEVAVWRGTPERSEWIHLRKWTTLYLPEHASVEAHWMDEDADAETGAPIESVDDLEEIVRDVVYYEDVRDLVERLGSGPQGTFNVVYPDPSFAGCTELSRKTSRGQFDELPYVPAWEARSDPDAEPTPTAHWWFMFLTAAVDYAAYYKFLTFSFDEAGDLMPQRARQDHHRLYDKVELARSCIADSRRAGLSILMGIHKQENVKADILKEFDRWIWMPDGKPNPVEGVRSTYPPGFDGVDMPKPNLLEYQSRDTALCFTENENTYFRWGDVGHDQYRGKKLVIKLGEPEEKPVTADADEPTVELEYDEAVFAEWQNQNNHRLYVKSPGSGGIDLDAAAIMPDAPLESPVEDLWFVEDLVERDGYREVLMTDENDEEIIVARIPVSSAGNPSGLG